MKLQFIGKRLVRLVIIVSSAPQGAFQFLTVNRAPHFGQNSSMSLFRAVSPLTLQCL